MKNKQYLLPIFFFLIILISHRVWLNLNSILTYGDWSFKYDIVLKKLYTSTLSWQDFVNLGKPNVQLYFNIFIYPWSILGLLGFSYSLVIRITILIPILILSYWSFFFFAKELIDDIQISAISAFFYSSTTYFIEKQQAHLLIAFVYAFTPVVFLLFVKALRLKRDSLAITFIFFTALFTGYEARIMYLTFFMLTLLFFILFVHNIKNKEFILFIKKHILLTFFVFLGVNSFWLLPTFCSSIRGNIESITSRPIFGSFLFDILHALTVSTPTWTGGNIIDFTRHPTLLYFWVVVLLIWAPVLLITSRKSSPYQLFFSLIAVIGIFLTKQESVPLKGFYSWMYYHIPTFKLFRISSKFYLLSSFGYSGLLIYSLFIIKNHFSKLFYILTSTLLIFISILNLRPLITGEIGRMFKTRVIPNDYIQLYDFITQNRDFFRNLFVPIDSRWVFYSNVHPKVSYISIIDNKIKEEQLHSYLNLSSIKYVIIPIRDVANDDDFFKYYGPREKFVKIVSQLPYLKKIDIGTKELLVFENPDFRPHIYTTNEIETIYKNVPYRKVNFKYINPTEYKIVLRDIKKPIYLNFSESFHSEWKIRLGTFKWYKVFFDKSYFISDKYHIKNDAGLNSFYIDPNVLCSQYSCQKNPDGSYNMYLTLYFKPQSYMYLGLIISGTTLALVLGYLGYEGLRFLRRRLN